jgi:hypothetical protein
MWNTPYADLLSCINKLWPLHLIGRRAINDLPYPEDFGGEVAEDTFLINPSCYVGYFGKYRVESDSTVVHLPEGGTILSYIETEQPSAYKLRGDSLWIEWSPETERLLIRLE